MEYDIKRLTDCHTGSTIKKYKKIFYEDDKTLDCYLIWFEDNYVLEINRDDITEKELKELIKKRVYVSIEFKIEIMKPRKAKT